MTSQTIKVQFADFWAEQNSVRSFFMEHFPMEISQCPDFVFYSHFGKSFTAWPDCVRIFCQTENVRPQFLECDYAISMDYPTNARNYRFPLYYWTTGAPLHEAARNGARRLPSPEKKKFCNFLFSNRNREYEGVRKRIAFFDKLCRYKKVDAGGISRRNLWRRVSRDRTIEFMRGYKFTISFENASHPGYTTEKILKALRADSIPVYWGNPLVHRDFNPAAFVNCHACSNFDEVIERIIEIDNDDDLYYRYLSAPCFATDIENAYAGKADFIRWLEGILRQKKIVRRTCVHSHQPAR